MTLLSMIFPDNIKSVSAYVIGNTASGKTNFLVDIGATYASNGFKVLHLSGENTPQSMSEKYDTWSNSHSKVIFPENLLIRNVTSGSLPYVIGDSTFDVIICDALQSILDHSFSINGIRHLFNLNSVSSMPSIWMSINKKIHETIPEPDATKVYLNNMSDQGIKYHHEQTIEIIQPIIKTTKRVIKVDHQNLIFHQV